MSDDSRTRVTSPAGSRSTARRTPSSGPANPLLSLVNSTSVALQKPTIAWTVLLIVLGVLQLLIEFGPIRELLGLGPWVGPVIYAAMVANFVVLLTTSIPASKPWIILLGILVGVWQLIDVWSIGNFLGLGPWWANVLYVAIAVAVVGALAVRQAEYGQKLEVASPQDAWGGLALIALAVFAVWASSDLPGQRGFAFGPGTAPRLFAGLLVILGIVISLMGLLMKGPEIGGYAIRGPMMVTASIVAFAFLIRDFGLVVSSFLTFMISATASTETRYVEATIMAVALTAFCVLLFVYLLNLPFQLCPRALQWYCRF